MGKLYYGDAVIRIRNAGLEPIKLVKSAGRRGLTMSGLGVKVSGEMHKIGHVNGLFEETDVHNLIEQGKQ